MNDAATLVGFESVMDATSPGVITGVFLCLKCAIVTVANVSDMIIRKLTNE